MSWWNKFSRKPKPEDEARVVLTEAEHSQAGRLAKLTGRTRDAVLREAYRKSDAILKRK